MLPAASCHPEGAKSLHGFVTDTDVLRDHAGHLARTAEELKPIHERFAPNGPAALHIDAFQSRTGWLHALQRQLDDFKSAYDEAQSGTEYRLRRIRDAVRESSRLLTEVAADYDQADAEAARRTTAAGR